MRAFSRKLLLLVAHDVVILVMVVLRVICTDRRDWRLHDLVGFLRHGIWVRHLAGRVMVIRVVVDVWQR